jgi:hypothetical protein
LELIHLFHQQHWQIIFASAATHSEQAADLSALNAIEQRIVLNDASFNTYVAALQPDAVLFDRFFTEEQFAWRVAQECPNALRILDSEDLHSLRHVRQQLLKNAQRLRHDNTPLLANSAEIYQHMCQDDMAQREIAAIYRCDLTLMISEYEISLLRDYFSIPAQLLHYCPFLTVEPSSQTTLPDFAMRQHFISIGNFRHAPNWDAVLYLKQAIWPLIHQQLPQTQCHIYGAYQPPKATQLHNPKQGFYIKGWAENALHVVQHARVCLAPLRFGAGIKGKLMDALRSGTPSVTTAIGAEAMTGGLPWAGRIENTTESFADGAVQLYRDESLWQAAQQQGFAILKQHFAKADYAQLLMERVTQLTANLAQERQQNFVGTLLRHQFHRSTQYMSLWIEAKNARNTDC